MIEFVIVVICLVLNGIFACFEMAFVTVTKPQLRALARDANSSAAKLLRLRDNPERTLSIIQIGITLVGMISAAVGGAGAEESFAPILERSFDLSENAAEAVAITIVVIPLTIFSVILGELVPKTIALRNPLRISILGATPIVIADRLMSPLVTFLEVTTKYVLKLLPKRSAPEKAPESEPTEFGNVSAPTRQYMLNLAETESRRVREVMVPWASVAKLSIEDDRHAVASAVVSSGHTRMPVVAQGEVTGLLHSKEFIAFLATEEKDWPRILRPVLFVRDTEMTLSALRQMQRKRTNMCVVVDRDAKPIGIVTMEDIIEEIVGDIYDEDDDGRIRQILSSHARWRAR